MHSCGVPLYISTVLEWSTTVVDTSVFTVVPPYLLPIWYGTIFYDICSLVYKLYVDTDNTQFTLPRELLASYSPLHLSLYSTTSVSAQSPVTWLTPACFIRLWAPVAVNTV